jgi:flagellar biosynthetic protein FliP
VFDLQVHHRSGGFQPPLPAVNSRGVENAGALIARQSGPQILGTATESRRYLGGILAAIKTAAGSHRYGGALIVLLAIVCSSMWWPKALSAESPKSQARTSRTRPFPNAPRDVADPVQFENEVRGNAGIKRVAQADPQRPAPLPEQLVPGIPNLNVDQFVSPQGLSSSLNVWLVVTVLSLAPAILMMSTCFVRFIVVLSLLRQALGTQNLPPNQVLMGLSLLLTLLVMAPVWNQSYQQGIRPYTDPAPGEMRPPIPVVFENSVRPLRRFMSQQIEQAHNPDAVWMFIEYQRPAADSPEAEIWHEPETYDDVPLTVLLPAYLLSELKTAFLIGFQIYLPFLIIDLVVAAVLMSMGMSMLSPTQISLPFKLLLFVLIDGWTLTVGMLIESVRAVT